MKYRPVGFLHKRWSRKDMDRKIPQTFEKRTDDYIDEKLVNGRIFRSQ